MDIIYNNSKLIIININIKYLIIINKRNSFQKIYNIYIFNEFKYRTSNLLICCKIITIQSFKGNQFQNIVASVPKLCLFNNTTNLWNSENYVTNKSILSLTFQISFMHFFMSNYLIVKDIFIKKIIFINNSNILNYFDYFEMKNLNIFIIVIKE